MPIPVPMACVLDACCAFRTGIPTSASQDYSIGRLGLLTVVMSVAVHRVGIWDSNRRSDRDEAGSEDGHDYLESG
jgi:hypothetical protein